MERSELRQKLRYVGPLGEAALVTAAGRSLIQCRGAAAYPRRGLDAVSSFLVRRPGSRAIHVDGLPTMHLSAKSGRLETVDWVQRVARLPFDALALAMSSICEPGDSVADVGAFTGWYSYLAAWQVGETGEVHTFEASPDHANALQRMFGPLSQVQLHLVGAGPSEGEMVFHRNVLSQGSFVETHAEDHDPVVVPVRPLDHYLSSAQAAGRLKFIKIDVEGFEGEVLRGLEGVLNADDNRPYLWIELNEAFEAARAGHSSEVESRLTAAGYRLFGVPTLTCQSAVPLWPLQSVPATLPTGWMDGLAVPPEREDDLDRLTRLRRFRLIDHPS